MPNLRENAIKMKKSTLEEVIQVHLLQGTFRAKFENIYCQSGFLLGKKYLKKIPVNANY